MVTDNYIHICRCIASHYKYTDKNIIWLELTNMGGYIYLQNNAISNKHNLFRPNILFNSEIKIDR